MPPYDSEDKECLVWELLEAGFSSSFGKAGQVSPGVCNGFVGRSECPSSQDTFPALRNHFSMLGSLVKLWCQWCTSKHGIGCERDIHKSLFTQIGWWHVFVYSWKAFEKKVRYYAIPFSMLRNKACLSHARNSRQHTMIQTVIPFMLENWRDSEFLLCIGWLAWFL